MAEIDREHHFLPLHEFETQQSSTPLSSRIRIDFGAVSHTGKVRLNNEDAYLIWRTGRFWEKLRTNIVDPLLPEHQEENGYSMAVADGMGGLDAGEDASRTALTTIVNLILTSVKWALKLDQPDTRDEEIREGINRAVSFLAQADLTISKRAKKEGAYKKMGTTLTATYSYADDLFIFHVGDSRAYLFREGELKQLTRDDTVAQNLADAGAILQSEAQHHRFKHMLTQAVGLEEGNVNVEIHHLKLTNGDRILLCSDGLSDLVQEGEIAAALTSDRNSQHQCEELLELALSHGGKDNITILIGHYQIP
jgi:serine/threonine protein phosphatase PrpC